MSTSQGFYKTSNFRCNWGELELTPPVILYVAPFHTYCMMLYPYVLPLVYKMLYFICDLTQSPWAHVLHANVRRASSFKVQRSPKYASRTNTFTTVSDSNWLYESTSHRQALIIVCFAAEGSQNQLTSSTPIAV